MNKINILILTLLFSIAGTSIYSQGRNRQATTYAQSEDIFYHTIERGQTVYAIATMYGIGAEDIYRLNPESKESIKAGFTLKIPQKNAETTTENSKVGSSYTYHTILPKETLYSLSQKYQTPPKYLIDANPGLSASTFTIGKTIRIPAKQIENLPTTDINFLTNNIDYTIDKKETMYGICHKFNVSSAELIRLNPILKNGVKAGMVIKIPIQSDEAVIEQSMFPKEREANALLTNPKDIKLVDNIRVAILLPFMTNETHPSSNTLRLIEYYEGILLAVDSLRNQGINIELYVYDTGNGTKNVEEILRDDILKQVNLIIGAVQNDQIALIANFAQKHNIKYVIPLTSKNDDVLSNESVFQVNTPHSYLYSKAAQAGCDLFTDYNIVLLNINDKDEKKEFIKVFKAEMNQRNIAFKELNYNGETFATDVKALLIADKHNVIVPTSSSLDALNKIKSPLRMLADATSEYGITLFGYPEWQTYTRECLDDFYALNTYIYTSFYADNLAPNVHNFYRNYKTWYSKNLINTFPKYGILGFDTGMYFLSAINKYGSNFENNLNNINYQSLQTGFNFQRVNNWGGFINTTLFVIHYKSDYRVTRNEVK